MVRALGLPALEARDAGDSVAKAVALARDPAARARLSAEIRTRAPAMFADTRGVRALEAVLAGAVAAAR